MKEEPHISRKKLLSVLLFFVVVLSMPLLSSVQSVHQETQFFNGCRVTATIERDGTITVETELIGSKDIHYEVFVDFTPSYDFCDPDSQDAMGPFGKVTASVYGYYNQYDTAYSCERHIGHYESLLGGYLKNVELTCIGDNTYDDVYTTYGSFNTYYEDIDTVCSTRFEAEVWSGFWHFGDVNVVAVIYGP